MKVLLTFILTFCTLVGFSQAKEWQSGELSIKGRVILADGDSVEKGSAVYLTDRTSKERLFTIPIYIKPNGEFEEDKVKAGTYRLRLRVNPSDCYPADTILVQVTKGRDNYFEVKLKKKPCLDNAQEDITNNKLRILVAGGTAPRMATNEDRVFEKKFNVRYVVMGDIILGSYTCLLNYNKEIFTALDKQYGTRWRKKAREDAIGLDKYKNNNP